MPKLLDGGAIGGVGRQAIYQLIDSMNTVRAARGIRQRYRPVLKDDELTMEFCDLDLRYNAFTPSQKYSVERASLA